MILKRLSNIKCLLQSFSFQGDMYESTVDVLYNLYDKLSVGGYVIMDDVSALSVFLFKLFLLSDILTFVNNSGLDSHQRQRARISSK
jgi:hypothetical protein